MARTLLCTDSDWVSSDVKASLSDSGDSLHETNDPRSVVEAINEYGPDVVLVDMQVGSMGGMAITRTIRQAIDIGRIKPVPVVLLLDRSADTFLARRAGAAGWVQKPFHAQQLKATIQSATTPAMEDAT